MILIEVLINVHLLVNELCEYQNARCNDKKSTFNNGCPSYTCTFVQKQLNK